MIGKELIVLNSCFQQAVEQTALYILLFSSVKLDLMPYWWYRYNSNKSKQAKEMNLCQEVADQALTLRLNREAMHSSMR